MQDSVVNCSNAQDREHKTLSPESIKELYLDSRSNGIYDHGSV
jgi:hypothetical protein